MAELRLVITDMTRSLGPSDPSTFAARYNLAQVRRKSGDRAGAITTFVRLFVEELRALGPAHPEVLDTRYELAHLRGEDGDVAGAVTAFTSLLADRERLLGHDHVQTELTRRSLAQWRRETANPPQEATAVPGGPLLAHAPVLCPDHPGTLPAYEAGSPTWSAASALGTPTLSPPGGSSLHFGQKPGTHPGPLPPTPACWCMTCTPWTSTT
ncbi:tetratricopeptide repeat protein [Streptomyces sp. NRRL F-2580]|uniref:tetratricopeptide repeat protein n=1 Tax=Streptomyces sp. NRRL F-2580 TaxID=1463841 RepID=UPI0004C99382|nr:tetratricopeptide repeat protein [Streptomyces sp. NRRL F-2580]